MLYSKLFGKTQRSISKQFEAKSHEFLTKAGYIDQVASGIFTLLPLGKKVLLKIENIIREELNNIGCQEVLMPLLHPKALWEMSGRWSTVDILFKTKSQFDHEYAIAPTHEEIITPLAKKFIKSYRDLPAYLYHITTKFRDEPRPKSGILRGKEFGMKDLYSFHADKNDLNVYYKKVIDSYIKIFKRCGLPEVKITEASGGSFTKKFSHEFNVLTEAGEVNLIYCANCSFAQNEEISKLKTEDRCPQCKGPVKKGKAIEIGNIFDLDTKFSQAFDFKYIDKEGQKKPVIMGCYGIGTTRLMGTVVEVYNDQRGIIWPENISPYQIHLVALDLKDESVKSRIFKIYKELNDNNIEVLFDDREGVSAGEKFADVDLIGIPIRMVVSKRTGDKVELKKRNENNSSVSDLTMVISKLKMQKLK